MTLRESSPLLCTVTASKVTARFGSHKRDQNEAGHHHRGEAYPGKDRRPKLSYQVEANKGCRDSPDPRKECVYGHVLTHVVSVS